jgi:hypothetical protein
MTHTIVLEVSHPDRAPGKIEGFRFVWAFQVNGFRPARHCQPCFKGRRVPSFCTPTARSGTPVGVAMNGRYTYVYVCGVGVGPKSELREQNLHLPLRYEEGEIATITTYNGYLVTARNAIALPIPPLPLGWKGLGDEMTRCKNFQFCVASFGYPTAGGENAMAKRPAEESALRRGPRSLFRDKVRDAPVTVTLTREHHDKVNAAMKRLTLTRADVLALLVEKYADTVTR